MANNTDATTHPGPAPDDLHELLARYRAGVHQITPVDEHALRAALCSYVRQLKAARLPPERVLVTIKAIAHREGVPLSVADALPVEGRLSTLMHTIVRWTVTEYYRPDETGPPRCPS